MKLSFCTGLSVCGVAHVLRVCCFTVVEVVLEVQLQRELTFLMRRRRALILKTPNPVDFLSTAFALMPLAPDLQNTRCARMTRRPPVAECRDETTCLRPNVLTGHKVSPDRTPQEARHTKWIFNDHLNQPQLSRNVRETGATQSHCCRTARSAPIGTPLTSWRAQKRQH